MTKKVYSEPKSLVFKTSPMQMIAESGDPEGNMSGGKDEVKEQSWSFNNPVQW